MIEVFFPYVSYSILKMTVSKKYVKQTHISQTTHTIFLSLRHSFRTQIYLIRFFLNLHVNLFNSPAVKLVMKNKKTDSKKYEKQCEKTRREIKNINRKYRRDRS